MKHIFTLSILLFSISFVHAQEMKADSNKCNCTGEIRVKYPDVAEEDELQGTVIVEYEVDSACIAKDPQIIQSLGGLFDQEALRVTKLIILNFNSCKLRCKFLDCKKGKIRFPLTFTKPGE